MKDANLQFFKKGDREDDRDRLDFQKVVDHCPDLGNRVVVIRSRVKDLRRKFRRDCFWALWGFIIVTSITIILALSGIIVGLGLSYETGWRDLTPNLSIAFGAAVALAGAATKSFGWHKQYHAMFRAQWAMASLEVRIDDLICDIAVGVEKDAKLPDPVRKTLRDAADSWLDKIEVTLTTFGDIYPVAISPVKIESTG